MAFQKTGDSFQALKVFCSCGQELEKDAEECPNCGLPLCAGKGCCGGAKKGCCVEKEEKEESSEEFSK